MRRSLLLWGNTPYGIASTDTVFAVRTDGSGFSTLHGFTAPDAITGANSDGDRPFGGLILSSNTLFGTTVNGGGAGNGTVFAVNTDGSGFTNLYSFSPLSGGWEGTNRDGAYPAAGLLLSGNTLYGTAQSGGGSGQGAVFALNTDGSGFTTLHHFSVTRTNSSGVFTNGDGTAPLAALLLSGSSLYGTAFGGGGFGAGTVYGLNTDGSGFQILHPFDGQSDGGIPNAGLILSCNKLYGTAYRGGSSDNGTVFTLSLPPPRLTLMSSASNIILTWPTNSTGFTLQSATNLGPGAVWNTNSPALVVVNGQYPVTNPISGTRQFFRLSQ